MLADWRDEHGIEWATELDADYAEAEEILRVRPVDPERMGRNGQLCDGGRRGARRQRTRRFAATPAAACQCSSCPFGCRLDAKRGMHVTYLPRAVAAGARVRAGRRGAPGRLRGRPRGRASTAWRSANGRARPLPRSRPAGAVVLAGGAFGTPELLLRSGLRSPSGQLGRNLRIHPACWVGARFEEEVRGWDGVMQSYYVDSGSTRGILLEATFTPLAFGAPVAARHRAREHQERVLAYDHIASIGVHLSDRSSGRVGLAGDGSLRVTYRLTDEDAERLVFGIARAAEIHFAAGATEVYPQIAGIPTIPKHRHRRARGLASSPLASCASRPSTRWAPRAWTPTRDRGVVGDRRRGPRRDGLYVADGSLLPELGRRQPDDDHHRDGLTRGPPDGGPAELTDPGTTTAARRRPSRQPLLPRG